ncbi:MAG: hypothetical protein ACT4PM_15370 [Gemmatimonadales bacterium]
MSRVTYAVLAAALLSASCLDTAGSSVGTFPFDFTSPAQLGVGWTAAVADVPADRVSEVELAGDYETLPAPYEAYPGMHQAGTNVSGDLFIFHKKWIQTQWTAGTRFRASLDAVLLSSYHGECAEGPGPAVLIKAGATGIEPVAAPDGQGILRLSVDKGTGTSGGQFVQLGDIRNPLDGCPAEGSWQFRGTSTLRQPEILEVDANGGFWIFFGTESSFAGRHDMYFLQIRLILAAE